MSSDRKVPEKIYRAKYTVIIKRERHINNKHTT
jgi:hypothetical protein